MDGATVRRLDTKREGLQVYCADAQALLASLPDASVSLIATDPPYYRVKDEPWDRQWDKPEGFLSWVGQLCDEFRRVLKPNGSLYLFASPQMACRVEEVVRGRFNVLNSIRWYKDAGWHQKTDEETLRSYLSPWEACIFAEQFGADGDSVAKLDDVRGFIFEPLRLYLDTERQKAGVSFDEVREYAGCAPGSGLPSHWFSRSQWMLPTAEQYAKLQRGFQAKANALQRPYSVLQAEYQVLRRDYEELRAEFEHLRRPFFATEVQATDQWEFPTVLPYPGKHPCEKPLALAAHIVSVSSREGDTVLDPFCGSGVFGEAALRLGRRAILGDASEHWSQYAAAKLDRQFGGLPVGCGRAKKPKDLGQPALFAEAS